VAALRVTLPRPLRSSSPTTLSTALLDLTKNPFPAFMESSLSAKLPCKCSSKLQLRIVVFAVANGEPTSAFSSNAPLKWLTEEPSGDFSLAKVSMHFYYGKRSNEPRRKTAVPLLHYRLV
jgi:hypothetical protein